MLEVIGKITETHTVDVYLKDGDWRAIKKKLEQKITQIVRSFSYRYIN